MKLSNKMKSGGKSTPTIFRLEDSDVDSFKEAVYARRFYGMVKTPLYLIFLIFTTVQATAFIKMCIDGIKPVATILNMFVKPIAAYLSTFIMESRIQEEMIIELLSLIIVALIAALVVAIPIGFILCNLIGMWLVGLDSTSYNTGLAKKNGLTVILAAYWYLIGIAVVGFFATKPIMNFIFDFNKSDIARQLLYMLYGSYFAIAAFGIIILLPLRKMRNNMSIFLGNRASVWGAIVIGALAAIAALVYIIIGESIVASVATLGAAVTAILLLLKYRKIIADL